jgi:uncharacterized membrane protein YiaA
MTTVLRIGGWVVFASGVVVILVGQSNGDITLSKWGAIIGCGGMITTYVANLLRQARRARCLPCAMRRSDGPPPEGTTSPPGTPPSSTP